MSKVLKKGIAVATIVAAAIPLRAENPATVPQRVYTPGVVYSNGIPLLATKVRVHKIATDGMGYDDWATVYTRADAGDRKGIEAGLFGALRHSESNREIDKVIIKEAALIRNTIIREDMRTINALKSDLDGVKSSNARINQKDTAFEEPPLTLEVAQMIGVAVVAAILGVAYMAMRKPQANSK